MSIGAIMVEEHLSTKLLTVEEYRGIHNNCQSVHLLLAQSHLSPTFHAESCSHPDNFRCDSFLWFSHFPATVFRWDNNWDRACVVLVSSDQILPAVRLLPTFGMVLAVAGSCHPEVAQFVPRDISSVTWPAFVVTPGCAPQDHNSSSNTFQVHERRIQPVYWSSAAYLKEQIAWNAPQICSHGQ